MSDYRDGLSLLQNISLDLVMYNGCDAEKAFKTADFILSSGSPKAKTENFKYILFYADFDEGESEYSEFENLSDITDEHVDSTIIDELVNRGFYFDEWHNWYLIKVKA